MNEFFKNIITFFTENQGSEPMNIPILVVALVVLLIALWICVIISKKNKLYVHHKKKSQKKAYI
jgi:hypothetical protein